MTCAFNRRTRANMARLARLCELTDVKIDQGPARMVGRAADELSYRLPAREIFADRCPLPDYLGGDLLAPTGIEIHPGGWVNLCAGLALGRARERSLGSILNDYDPRVHPIIRVLVDEGPVGLLKLAEARGYVRGAGYADDCHLCYEARRFLRPHYSGQLAPAHPYLRG